MEDSHPLSKSENNKVLIEELHMLDEDKSSVALKEVVIKQRMTIKYNKRVKPHKLEVGNLILQKVDVCLKNARQGKLAPNMEGSY